MDLSILAAIGSFAISEAMLRPKSAAMVGLTMMLCHDLATHSNDPASLRIYRGPGLLAFALYCAALSLRLWRRNGVACDELIFIPGTPLEEEDARHGPYEVELENLVNSPVPSIACAGGLVGGGRSNRNRTTSSSSYVDFGGQEVIHDADADGDDEGNDGGDGMVAPTRLMGPADGAGGVGEQEGGESSGEGLRPSSGEARRQRAGSRSDGLGLGEEDGEGGESTQDALMRKFLCGLRLNRLDRYRRTSLEEGRSEEDDGGEGGEGRGPTAWEMLMGRGGEEGDGTDWAYAPSGASVLGAALDLSLPVFLNFHLFIAAFNHPRYAEVQTPKIFPLIFLSVLTLRAIFPRGKRRRFWGSLQYTMAAPLFRVNFRDEIIGDVLTSLVRPIQDVVFAYYYYATVLTYGIDDAAERCERSRLLHVLVLPACAICPLWWRFLQTLRQARDHKRRWPYLGNALKYFSATMIVLYDMGHPEGTEGDGGDNNNSASGGADRKMWWVLAFVSATLYQIWWDTFMDWELFVIIPQPASDRLPSDCLSSVQPSGAASLGLAVHRRVLQPLMRLRRRYCFCPGDRITLRSKRMYKRKSLYWAIFVLNTLFRFCWMLSFIPAKHISSSGKVVYSFSADVQSYVGPIVACAEICRRCMWGLLKVELESIKLYHADDDECGGDEDDGEGFSSAEQEKGHAKTPPSSSSAEYATLPTSPFSSARLSWLDERMSACLDRTLTAELCLWAVTFVGLGLRAVSA